MPSNPNQSGEQSELEQEVLKIVEEYGADDDYGAYPPGAVEKILALIRRREQIARKQAASDILNLANEYANQDPKMVGSENIRNYHYFNAINSVGEFDNR